MDQIFTAIGDAIGSIFDNPVVQLGIQLAVIYWIVLWLAASYWAFRDMQSRTDNPLAPYLAAAFVIIFTPILFPLAVFTYRIIRPQERIGEVYERNLAEEAMLAEIEAIPHCPSCERRVDGAWIICPTLPDAPQPRLPQLHPARRAWTGRCARGAGASSSVMTRSRRTSGAPIVSLPTREALPSGEVRPSRSASATPSAPRAGPPPTSAPRVDRTLPDRGEPARGSRTGRRGPASTAPAAARADRLRPRGPSRTRAVRRRLDRGARRRRPDHDHHARCAPAWRRTSRPVGRRSAGAGPRHDPAVPARRRSSVKRRRGELRRPVARPRLRRRHRDGPLAGYLVGIPLLQVAGAMPRPRSATCSASSSWPSCSWACFG